MADLYFTNHIYNHLYLNIIKELAVLQYQKESSQRPLLISVLGSYLPICSSEHPFVCILLKLFASFEPTACIQEIVDVLPPYKKTSLDLAKYI